MTTPDVPLRRATDADAPAVRGVVRDAYAKYVQRMGREPMPMTADYALAVRENQIWLAGDPPAIDAILELVPEADHLLIANIAVRSDRQGAGLGRQLLDFADAEAKRQGYNELRLYTHITMTENVAMYEHLGWEETDRGGQDGFERVFMRKFLRSRQRT